MKDAIVYTVTQITRELRGKLEETFNKVWVEGEVSNFVISSAGHAYFSLKDKDSLLNCVMFKGNNTKLKFEIEDGMHIVSSGKISVYDKRGQYQLYVTGAEPKGKGALQVAFEQLKTKLSAEGLFNEETKKEIPLLPAHIGIITSPTGAAVRDILKVAKRRFENIEISIRPVRVQGDESASEIAAAIKELNEFNDMLKQSDKPDHPIDLMIVGRGGGSLEDLWPFNEEIVARAIYASQIPVISAVGHEIDYTISDFVADLRAPTPSAAAEIALPRKEELVETVYRFRRRLYLAAKSGTEGLKKISDALCDSYVLKSPVNVILRIKQQVDDALNNITTRIGHLIELKQRDLGALAGKLNMLSPLAVLERGYSITLKEGKVLKDIRFAKKGDIIETRLHEGYVVSEVTETRSEPPLSS